MFINLKNEENIIKIEEIENPRQVKIQKNFKQSYLNQAIFDVSNSNPSS